MKIALRYLFARKKQNAINIISGIAILAFSVCSAALVVILSTMNGFENLIFSMYNKFNPDIKITLNEGKVFDINELKTKIGNQSEIQSLYYILKDNAVAKIGDNQTVCTVVGVDSSYLTRTGISGQVVNGYPTLKEDNISYAVMGVGVSSKLNINLNNPYQLISLITPRRGDFSVSDPSAIAQLEIQPGGEITIDETVNNQYVYVDMEFAQQLFERQGKASAIEINVRNKKDIEPLIDKIKSKLGKTYKIQNRMQQQSMLYKMFKSEKWASYAILTFILIIATFNALGSLTMLVIEKKKDIKTMIALGSSKAFIKKIFFTNGLLIALIGCCIGMLIGTVLVLAQQHYGLIKMQGAIVEYYPVKLAISDLILILTTCFVLGIITGIIPAQKAIQDSNVG